MDVFALVTAGIGLCLALVGLYLTQRTANGLGATDHLAASLARDVAAVDLKIETLVSELPESKLTEVEAWIRAIKSDFDALVTQVEQHRAGVHRSIQRVDQVMRRNERAAAVIEADQAAAAGGVDTEIDEDEPITQTGARPTDLPVPVGPVQEPLNMPRGTSPDDIRRELQRQYWANRGR